MNFGNAIASVGQALNLPEFGISERFGSTKPVEFNAPYGFSPNQTQQQALISGYNGPFQSVNNNPVVSAPQSTNASPSATQSNSGGQVLGFQAPQQNVGQGVSSGPDYSAYFAQLDQMVNDLGGQSQNLQNVAQAQAAQQQNTLDLQNTQGQQQLGDYQAKSLKDIGASIGSAFKAGNTYLGSIGAGDSSAANQYAYALAKEGSKQRGAVMADVSQRLQGIKQTYDTATNNLKQGLVAQVNQIAQWFSQQQNALRGQKAEVAKQQSDQAYQMAVNALQTVQQQAAGMQNALNTWIANNAGSIQQAQQQIQQNVKNNPIPTAMNLSPQASIASAAPAYFNGANTNDIQKQNGLFNNYNWLNAG